MGLAWLVLIFRSGRLKRRLLGSLRAAAYLVTVSSVLCICAVRSALGQVGEQTLALGTQLMPLADLLDGATRVDINGQSLAFSMVTLEGTSVREVLDRMQRHCERYPGPFARRIHALAASVPSQLPGSDAVRALLRQLAVSREETEDRGAILCLTGRGAAASDAKLDAFAESLDLGLLGNLRYVVVNRGDRAAKEAHITRVVSLWTEDDFQLSALTPPVHGDAPGSDSELVPRPPASTRIFTALAHDAPYAVRVYETDATASEVLHFYDRVLHDWAPVELSGSDDRVRGFVKRSQPLVINISRDETKTLVTLSEIGSSPHLRGSNPSDPHAKLSQW